MQGIDETLTMFKKGSGPSPMNQRLPGSPIEAVTASSCREDLSVKRRLLYGLQDGKPLACISMYAVFAHACHNPAQVDICAGCGPCSNVSSWTCTAAAAEEHGKTCCSGLKPQYQQRKFQRLPCFWCSLVEPNISRGGVLPKNALPHSWSSWLGACHGARPASQGSFARPPAALTPAAPASRTGCSAADAAA